MRRRYSKSAEMHELREFVNTPKKVTVVCLLGYLALQVQQSSAATWDDYCKWNLTLGRPCYIDYFRYSGPNFGNRQITWRAESYNLRLRLSCGFVNLPRSANCKDAAIFVGLGNGIVHSHCGTDWFIEHSTGNVLTVTLVESNNGNELHCSILLITPENEYCTCGRRNPTRIVGGKETGVNEFPMMVGLAIVDPIEHHVEVYCGGTIISPTYILTAAHCLTRRDLGELAVLVGMHNITKGAILPSGAQASRVRSVKIHPRYNTAPDGYAYDIAIVETSSKINFSASVGPACLPFKYTRYSFVGENVTVLGWGLLEFAGQKADVLRAANLTVRSSQTCWDAYKTDGDKTLCTYTSGADSCQMDSGGPCLWLDHSTDSELLVGIISAGSGCADDQPGINQRVSAYLDWIIDGTLDFFYCIK